MLIDEFMSQYDFSEMHDIGIRSEAKNVFRILKEVDVCESPIIRWLFYLRGLPSKKMTLADLQKISFEVLDEIENREIVIGLAGRFWTPTGGLQKVNADNFREFNKKGFAKAAWNFSLAETNGQTLLTTETRIECLDAESRRSFGLYWTFIQPFSGLIRKEMLKIVKKKAESKPW